MTTPRIPIACSLDPTGLQQQVAAWNDVGAGLRKAERHDAGVTLWFDASVEAQLTAVVAREATCCAFLTLALQRDGDDVRLDISSEDPEARPVIDVLADAVGAVAS